METCPFNALELEFVMYTLKVPALPAAEHITTGIPFVPSVLE